MRKCQAGPKLFLGSRDDSCFLRHLQEAVLLSTESTLKVKHRPRFSFADAIVANSVRTVGQGAKCSNAWEHHSSPKDISEHTEVLLQACFFQQHKVWLQQYLGGPGHPH